jgi:hypothetical protein
VPTVENPALFPGWVWAKPPPDFDAPRKRGGPVFELMKQMGMRVEVFEGGDTAARVPIWRPWTYIVLSLPAADCSEWMGSLDDLACSVIMDCHFPIMNMGNAIGANSDIVDIIDNKPILLANLALADVITVPQPGWAADLAEVNPNVFLLPDFDEANAEAFSLRLMEIAQASVGVKQARQAARREMGL